MFELIKGKRTYLTVVIGLLYVLFCEWQGIEPDENILAILGFSAVGFLRASQTGSPSPTDDREGQDDAHETVVMKRPPGGSGGFITPSLAAIVLAALLLICPIAGCSTFSTKQKQSEIGTNRITETQTRVVSFWDADSELARFRTTQTDKSQGISVGALGQSTTSTNVTSQIGELRDLVREIKTPLPIK